MPIPVPAGDIVFGIPESDGQRRGGSHGGTGRTDHLFGKAGADLLPGPLRRRPAGGGNGGTRSAAAMATTCWSADVATNPDLGRARHGPTHRRVGSGPVPLCLDPGKSSPDEFHADRLTGDKAHAAAFDGAGAAGGDVIDFRQIDADADKAGHQI